MRRSRKATQDQPPVIGRLLLTSAEAAEALAVSEDTITSLANVGLQLRLPVVRIGRSVRYSPDDLRCYARLLSRQE